MKKSMIAATGASLILGSGAFAQDIPDTNPIANPDGTMTWYTGVSTQFPQVQQVLDACAAGDEIVIMGGTYAESLSINTPDINVRCSTNNTANGPEWNVVNFWNPTQNDDGKASVTLGVNTDNSYLGRPRQLSQLANGSIVFNQVPVATANNTAEWVAAQSMTAVCVERGALGGIAAANMTALENGSTNAQLTDAAAGNALSSERAMQFRSRSIDGFAVHALGGSCTVSYVVATSFAGFGGGILADGTNNASFIGCTIRNTFSGGLTTAGAQVAGISIEGGTPTFSGCVIGNRNQAASATAEGNTAGAMGVISHKGGQATFSGCNFGHNTSPVSDGMYRASNGGHADFISCTFNANRSRFGTTYFDSTMCSTSQNMTFTDCVWVGNSTANAVTANFGSAAYCVDNVAGRAPMVVVDRCEFQNVQQGTITANEWWESDVRSNYFPRMRVLRDCTGRNLAAGDNPGGATGAAANTGGSLDTMAGDVNRDGTVDGMDLAALLANWS